MAHRPAQVNECASPRVLVGGPAGGGAGPQSGWAHCCNSQPPNLGGFTQHSLHVPRVPVRGRFLPLQGLVESGLGRRRERQAEVRFVGLAAPLATAQSHGYPRVQGRLGNGVSCVQETGGHGMMATPTPGPLGPCSGLEVSRVPAAELLPWKGNSDGVVSSGSWV